MTDSLLVSTQDAVATLTFNRPAVMNAMDLDMTARLKETTESLCDDSSIRAVSFSLYSNSRRSGRRSETSLARSTLRYQATPRPKPQPARCGGSWQFPCWLQSTAQYSTTSCGSSKALRSNRPGWSGERVASPLV